MQIKRIIAAALVILFSTQCFAQTVIQGATVQDFTYQNVLTTVFTGSVAVPSNFNGLTITAYPKSRVPPNVLDTNPPTFGYAINRDHDYDPGTSNGVTWAALQNGYNNFTGPMTGSWDEYQSVAATVSGVSVVPAVGSVYTNNGYLGTVVNTAISGGAGIIYMQCGGACTLPNSSGTLTNVSGTGDATISFSNWRSIYQFSVSGVTTNPAVGDTYTNNGYTYTVWYATPNGGVESIFAYGSAGLTNPSTSGTLTRTAGSGDSTIAYSQWQFQGGETVDQAWAYLDQVVNANYAANIQTDYVLECTPWFAAANQNQPGGCVHANTSGPSPPVSNTYASQFITYLIGRYNTGGLNKINYVEEWNEPSFDGYDVGGGYWSGTAAQLATMSKAVYQAAKAAATSTGTTVTVISPGFANMGYMTSYLAASDGGTGTGATWLDMLIYHPYGMAVPIVNMNFSGVYPTSNYPGPTYTAIQTIAVAAGLPSNVPIAATENGISADIPSAGLNNFSDIITAKYIFQDGVYMMVAGWKFNIWYSYEKAFDGNPYQSTNVSAAMAALYSLQGKTITQVQISNIITTVVTCSDGTVVTF